ncbi:DUF2795 domain-containing protein [Microtetraspora sp. AC03309]|uniref:DUF2795 domain-containing protein n=1 Tax=Microtetraspora sp. AC03309 TaxID=2779376 RepID=UPI001E314E5F|nr:DUF2795 domain-containing protein [Microtetraspora sp. AC03309]MCC5577873.1 DUF2795 domain-containing protein [Microtetraspora sp. AC03309]
MSIRRGSDEHGPRMDDEQKHETEGLTRGGGTAHAEESKEPEPTRHAAEDVPPGRRPPGSEPGTHSRITPADVERRSHLAQWLSDAEYPANRENLLAHAETKSAPDAVIEAVRQLPELKFHNVGEVAEALGLGVERHRC